jgi:AraC-type DNA-binding domain-containing proteins
MNNKSRSYTFFNTPIDVKRDPLTDFINGMSFIPHACGYQCNDPEAVCNERITGDFELIYIIGGKSYITIGSNTYTCIAGDAVLIPPFTMHKIQTPENDPHEDYWIHFDIYPFYEHGNFIATMRGINDKVMHPGIQQELLQLYKLLMHEVETEKPGRMIFFNAILMQVITIMLRLGNNQAVTERPVQSSSSGEAEVVRKCLELIQSMEFHDMGITELCHKLHVSESWLFKAFSSTLKMPPNKFIQMVRMKKAEQLMKSTSLSIKEISEMLGYSSPFYFSNVFKKFYKLSPKRYMEIITNHKFSS